MADQAKSKMAALEIATWCLAGVLVSTLLIMVAYKFSDPSGSPGLSELTSPKGSAIFSSLKDTFSGKSSGGIPWHVVIPLVLLLMVIYYFSMATIYANTKGLYRSKPPSIAKLTLLRSDFLSKVLHPLAHSGTTSVCDKMLSKTAPYNTIPDGSTNAGDKRSMLNFRPLTVRLPGYLGGANGSEDGVFDRPADLSVQLCLERGARGFFLDIDFEEASPCKPEIIYRDRRGIKRSLNNGSIKEIATALAIRAFTTNYDPVLVILYIRRLPIGPTQQSLFLKNIAAALDPLSDNHLGNTEHGIFNNCRSEGILFNLPITAFQKKFIIMTNYDTTKIPKPSNPKDNLDWWTNMRIFSDAGYTSAEIGKVTQLPPPAPKAYAKALDIQQVLNTDLTSAASVNAIKAITDNTFCILITTPDYTYNMTDLENVLNVYGVQCVLPDILPLAVTENHRETIDRLIANPKQCVSALTNATNLTSEKPDPLSYWAYAGWSLKPLALEPSLTTLAAPSSEGFFDYTIPKPIPPTKPNPAMNAGGGAVIIK